MSEPHADTWDEWERQLDDIEIPTHYEYLVLGDPTINKIYLSKHGTMGHHHIAAQLRRLADYVDGLTDEEAAR